jgi:SAM-dependent methyltransferase
MSDKTYAGSELALFSSALNWKNYLRRRIRSYLGKHVLEIGAGLGATTHVLCTGDVNRWVCLEPDPRLASQILTRISDGELPDCCQVVVGTLEDDLDVGSSFDTVLYIDVLEHIEDDLGELRRAASYVRPNGYLVVLAPAHQWLFTPFDQAIGHFRRYTKRSLAALTPGDLQLVHCGYMDAVGLLASVGNRVFLRRAMPTPRQIATWDQLMVPLSWRIDPLLRYMVGKSVLAVWRQIR